MTTFLGIPPAGPIERWMTWLVLGNRLGRSKCDRLRERRCRW